MANDCNMVKQLCGKQKSAAFWSFAHIFMMNMRIDEASSEFIDDLYKKLSFEQQIFFSALNQSSATHRRHIFNTIIFTEAPFLL